MYTPVNPSFTISKWGLRGSKLYRHVFVMDASIALGTVMRAEFVCISVVRTASGPREKLVDSIRTKGEVY